MKRAKHPRLPSGYGTIRYLGKGRRNPYAVHPPSTDFDENGHYKLKPALCYVQNWITGMAVLTAYHAGTYTRGMERELEMQVTITAKLAGEDKLLQAILGDYNKAMYASALEAPKKTFKEVFEEFYKWKFERPGINPSRSSKDSYKIAFKNSSVLHDKPFVDLQYSDLQAVVDDCPLKHASKELILTLFKQMYKYADIVGITNLDASKHVAIVGQDEEEHGIPFSNEEMDILKSDIENPVAEMLVIMCYSGFRISAYRTLEVNLEENYFKGGVKTAAGKNRIVPIHSGILPLVKRRIERDGQILSVSPGIFRKQMSEYIQTRDIAKHTPHDTRHTFSMLCERYKVSETDRKRMLGHALDLTNGVYGHRTVEELREEIEKIKY